jgi:hypothetical protein
MSTRKIVPRIVKFALFFIGIALVLFALQVIVLAYPQLLLSHSAQSGTVTIHYDGEMNPDMDRMAAEVDRRLSGCRFYNPTRSDDVYVFQDRSLYNFITRLAMVHPDTQGFNLSIFGNSYVCVPLVKAKLEQGGIYTKYSVWEGSIVHTVAHEIGHQYWIDLIGRSIWTGLPHWKQEGFPEYVANIGAIHEDSLANLPSRIDNLNDDRLWDGYRRWDRVHYEAGLLVEFLLDVEGYTAEEIIADSVTREETLAAMKAWYDTTRQGP